MKFLIIPILVASISIWPRQAAAEPTIEITPGSPDLKKALSDPAWKTTKAHRINRSLESPDTKPTHNYSVRFLYDSKALYAAFVCGFESPDLLVSDPGTPTNGDSVRLDFPVAALGIDFQGRSLGLLIPYEIPVESHTEVGAKEWTAVLAVPWSHVFAQEELGKGLSRSLKLNASINSSDDGIRSMAPVKELRDVDSFVGAKLADSKENKTTSAQTKPKSKSPVKNDSSPLVVTLPRVDTPPEVDGILDDRSWLQASEAGAVFAGWRADLTKRTLAPQQRIAYAVYDQNGIWLAMQAFTTNVLSLRSDPSGNVAASDALEIDFVRPSGEHVKLISDIEGRTGTLAHSGEVEQVRFATQYGDNNWTLEAFIPWSVLGAKPEEGLFMPLGLANNSAHQGGDLYSPIWWGKSYGVKVNRNQGIRLGPSAEK